jgi:hypothetical protein
MRCVVLVSIAAVARHYLVARQGLVFLQRGCIAAALAMMLLRWRQLCCACDVVKLLWRAAVLLCRRHAPFCCRQ